jgi:hypothetical protein
MIQKKDLERCHYREKRFKPAPTKNSDTLQKRIPRIACKTGECSCVPPNELCEGATGISYLE